MTKITVLLPIIAASAAALTGAHAATTAINFDGGFGPVSSSGGPAAISYYDATTQGLTVFGMTDAAPIPDFPDGPGPYLFHPAFGNGGAGGYAIDFAPGTFGGNGGGAFVNDYTIVTDILVPAVGWTAIFNTNPNHANDADFYISPSGQVGIGALGYSASGVISANQWYRLAFVQDATNNTVDYYVDGVSVFSGAAGAVDGRFSLYTGANPGADLVFQGEGDSSGNYSNAAYIGSMLVADRAYSGSEIAALGGASALGLAPEPSRLFFGALGLAGIFLRRRR